MTVKMVTLMKTARLSVDDNTNDCDSQQGSSDDDDSGEDHNTNTQSDD